MYKYLFLLVFGVISVVKAQSYKEIDCAKEYLQSKKKFRIKPNVDCNTVETCFIKYGKYCISVIKPMVEDDKKKIVLNENLLSIKTLYNQKEELSIENIEFPDYENSDYYFVDEKFYIINSIPFCTGISCKYRYVQIIDVKNKLVHEKKIKWDK